jgi:cytoskeletal protein CcmA (bactofilin family)
MWQEKKQENIASAARSTPVAPTPVIRTATSGTPDITIIGKGMLIKGRVESRQDMYVDGEVEGSMDAPNCRLTIGPNGKAHAGATARELEILGVIDGNVESTEKVLVRTGGRLVGNVRTAGIVIEDGAFFKGSIDIVRTPPVRPVEPSPSPSPTVVVAAPVTSEA